MMRIAYTLFLLMVLTTCIGQENTAFQAANQAYSQGDYKTAIEAYKQLTADSQTSAELHYNLGSAYFKNNQLGEAILHLEKALKLKPGDKNIQENLSIASESVELEVLQVPPFFLVRFWRAFHGVFSSSVWVVIQMALVLGLLYGLYLWILSRVSIARLRGLKLVAVLFPLLLLAYFAGRSAHHAEVAKDDGVVLSSAALVSAPLDSAETLEDLTPGVKVEILDQLEAWYKVSLANKAQGWVKKETVGII